MSTDYISFRPDVTVIYDADEDSFRLVVDWDDAYEGPYDEDGERTPLGETAQEWLDRQIQDNPILNGTAQPWPFGSPAPVEEPVRPQPFLTCRHFCPSSEQPELAGPKTFDFDQRFPFPNCANRAIMPNGFGPCRAYGRNMPLCHGYEADEPTPVALITKAEGTKTLVSKARITLGNAATILSDPDETGVFSQYDGTAEEAVAELVNLGGEASEPESNPPSFLATLVGADGQR